MRQSANLIRIERNGFVLEEAFGSKADAAEWKRMIESVLMNPDPIGFDLQRFAAELASFVRGCGAKQARKAWLNVFATASPPDLDSQFDMLPKLQASVAVGRQRPTDE